MPNLNIVKKLSAVAAASVLAVLATQGRVSALSIYLGNGLNLPEVDDEFTYNQGNISVKATGKLANGGNRNVYRSTLGLGVTINALPLENNQIDGVGVNEILNLTFNQSVNLISATFAKVGTNDSFKLLVDGNQFIAADIPGGSNNILDWDISNFRFNPAPTGIVFGFTVNDNNDDYFLKYVEVEAVPEPITMGGLALGAGFGAFLKTRYSKKKNELENA